MLCCRSMCPPLSLIDPLLSLLSWMYNHYNNHYSILPVLFHHQASWTVCCASRGLWFCGSFGSFTNSQWIGLRDKLQERPMILMGTSMVSGQDFPVKTNPLKRVVTAGHGRSSEVTFKTLGIRTVFRLETTLTKAILPEKSKRLGLALARRVAPLPWP